MNQLERDIDTMRDMYMSRAQREAYERIRALATHPSRGVVDEDEALADFTEYFVRNYPGPDTIIGNPKWHAPRIFRAAMHALQAAALPAVPDGVNAEAIGRGTWHIGKAIEYIEKQYPNGRTLDRGPIMRNMRRWHAQLLAATLAHDQPEGEG